jgi:hypothetical protein
VYEADEGSFATKIEFVEFIHDKRSSTHHCLIDNCMSNELLRKGR